MNYNRKSSTLFITVLSILLIFTLYNISTSTTTLNYIKPPITVRRNTGPYTKVEIINELSEYDNKKDTVLVLSTIGNGKSYGKDKTIDDLFNTIQSFDFSVNQMSVGFLIGNEEEFENVVHYFEKYFAGLNYKTQDSYIKKITLLSAPFIEENFKNIDRKNRHDDKVQRLRRRNIAKSRNFVLNNALDFEKYTLFIDADIVKIHNSDMLMRFIHSKKDIIVPRVTRGGNPDYDKNSWKGQRTIPNEEQFKKMDENDWDHWDYVPRDVDKKMVHFSTFLDENRSKDKDDVTKQVDYSIELDSVGGAILFAKSIIYHQGIQFPPNYIIGTTWDRLEGYDGIETEGLCYVAKSSGYKCYGYPNLVAEHSLE